jgi:hypothetical protein
MAHGPYWDDLPADGSGKKYVSKTAWNTLLANIIGWQANQNAGNFNLSGLGTLTFGAAGGVADGSASVPALRFASDQDTGIYRSATDTMAAVTAGVSRMVFGADGSIVIPSTSYLSGPHRVQPAPGYFSYTVQTTIANGATVALETLFGVNLTSGILTIYVTDALTAAVCAVRAGYNSVVELSDPLNGLETTDTGARICVLADGDATYSIKNRSGAAQAIVMHMIGL